jgi:hypothetical protein
MLVLRCTRKLLDRLPHAHASEGAESTTVLGDWYANILMIRPAHLVVLVNERSRLPLALPAREFATLLDRIPDAVAETLSGLGAPSAAITQERFAMRTIQCAPTRSRSVLGAMNEFCFQIQRMLEDGALPDLRTLNDDLAQLLIGVGGREYLHPADEARRLLGWQSEGSV